MQTRKERISTLHYSYKIDFNLLNKKCELLKRLASVSDYDWTEEHDQMLIKLEEDSEHKG